MIEGEGETMSTQTVHMVVLGTTWLGSRDSDEYWAQGEAASLEVERTDENEIRLGVTLTGSESDDATFYLTLGEATRLAQMVGMAVLDA